MKRFAWNIGVLALAAVAAGAEDTPRTPMPAMKPSAAHRVDRLHESERPRESAALAWSGGRWLVWTIRDQEDFRTEAERFRIRYYRQELYRPETTLVYETARTVHGQDVVGVLDDGTVLLHWSRQLTWITPQGQSIVDRLDLPGDDSRILQGFCDGVLLQITGRPARSGHVYFAPIADRKIAMDKKVQLTEGDGLLAYYPWRFLRHGSLLAWDNRVFDLTSGRRRTFEPPEGMKKWTTAQAAALDGQTLILHTLTVSSGNAAVSLADGKVTPIEHPGGEGQHRWVRFLAVRNRIGYILDATAKPGTPPDKRQWRLMARDLNTPGGASQELLSFPVSESNAWETRQDLVGIPHIVADEGLVLWDGTEWRTVRWLNAMATQPTR